ncbi:MAG: hypothetical protein R3F61_07735 [Myxococcota bacterium]
MSDFGPLTKTGNLQPHLAAAACYVPVMYVHLLASLVFLVTEPREHRFVRFHATQSMLVTAGWLGSTVVLLILMVLAPFLGIFLGALLSAASEELGALLMFVGILGEIFFGMLAILAAFAGPVVLFGCTLMAAMEKDIRIPVLAGLADRFAGPVP